MPVAPLSVLWFWSGRTEGRLVSRVSTDVVPWAWISGLPTVVTGLLDTKLVCGIRDPVITIAWTVFEAPVALMLVSVDGATAAGVPWVGEAWAIA